MRVGLHALGIGTGADPDVISTTAIEAERHGFATLWSGEHVVMVDDGASRYPYADDGEIAVPAVADWLDPMITLSYAAAATSTIKLATGILLLPEHNPVVVAKQVASLDRLSRGRFKLGVGIGWSAEEFQALGVPFERRGLRTASYVAAMRTLWAHDVASFESEFVSFSSIRVNPKPLQDALPVIVGGNSDSALRRVAAWGDGWYGFNLDGARPHRPDARLRPAVASTARFGPSALAETTTGVIDGEVVDQTGRPAGIVDRRRGDDSCADEPPYPIRRDCYRQQRLSVGDERLEEDLLPGDGDRCRIPELRLVRGVPASASIGDDEYRIEVGGNGSADVHDHSASMPSTWFRKHRPVERR
ncbi:MAG TPA: LLM class F420-dependent oxidoreductase [Microlunatus sp.]